MPPDTSFYEVSATIIPVLALAVLLELPRHPEGALSETGPNGQLVFDTIAYLAIAIFGEVVALNVVAGYTPSDSTELAVSIALINSTATVIGNALRPFVFAHYAATRDTRLVHVFIAALYGSQVLGALAVYAI